LRVGYVGGISWQKGVHVLITAVNQHPKIKLTIVGDLVAFPDYVNELRGMAGGNVTFAGRIPHAELWQTLADFDLIVVPTLWYETASLIVQEAFAAGVPVVASRIGVFPERVNDGVDGLLFPTGNADALADLLRHLHDNPQKLALLRAGIQPVFTIDEHVTAIEKIMNTELGIMNDE
jgi:glycosyltransferase involved in cell wall biosynthesis